MNKADKLFKDFKTVKYKVTTLFGDSEFGEIRDTKLICDEGDKALLYHVSSRGFCGSFEICILGKHEGQPIWVSQTKESYVNYVSFGK